jgi:hypothetical protein
VIAQAVGALFALTCGSEIRELIESYTKADHPPDNAFDHIRISGSAAIEGIYSFRASERTGMAELDAPHYDSTTVPEALAGEVHRDRNRAGQPAG